MKKIIFMLTGFLIFIDQILKYLVINNLEEFNSIRVIPNFFHLTFIKNEGAAFSILSGGRWFFIGIGLIALIFLIRYICLDKKICKLDIISYSLVLSGIIGNLIDRICYGSVIDYLDFYLFNYDAPIFNFADMCIVIGGIIIIYTLVVKGDNDENNYSRK